MNDAIRIPVNSDRWAEMYEIQSESRSNVSYVIAKDQHGRWACSCPRWIYTTPRQDCKHIRHVKAQIACQVQMRSYTEAEVQAKPAIKKAISRFSLIEV